VRAAAIGAAAVLFLAISLVVAAWLSADGDERAKVEDLLRAQLRGDVPAMQALLRTQDAGELAKLAVRFRRDRGADLEVVRYDSKTAHALGGETAPTRVVWQPEGGLTVVQCVLVRRTGSVLTGPSVTLLRLSEPIGREEPC
jgi:hypothetical protein